MNFRTDLALEAHKINGGQTEGTVFESEKKSSLKISRLHIQSDSAAQKLEKPKGRYNMIPINKRNIATSIILSFVTLGIYLIYWEYLLVKNIRVIKKDESS